MDIEVKENQMVKTRYWICITYFETKKVDDEELMFEDFVDGELDMEFEENLMVKIKIKNDFDEIF